MKCLSCDSKARCSGLCHACYQQALRSVKSGKTTWAKLVKEGRAVRKRRGPKPKFIL